METFLFYFTAFVISFFNVFIRAFQHKNVVGNHYKSAGCFAYLICLFEIATIGLIVSHGWQMLLPLGTGAALGVMSSMYVHTRFFSK